jgi:hypothetical protein
MTSLASDPIHAAIANHQAAAKDFDAGHARLVALLPDVPEADDNATQNALRAEIAAAEVLIVTSPTTRTGLQALTVYLREERQHGVAQYVDQGGTLEDGRTYVMHDGTGAEKLIAWRAAELG